MITSLGNLLIICAFISFWAMIFYFLGRRDANKTWVDKADRRKIMIWRGRKFRVEYASIDEEIDRILSSLPEEEEK